MAGFLFQDPLTQAPSAWLSWVPGALYLVAALMDAADGWAARATGGETHLGEILDTEIDAMGILVASLLLVSNGKAPLVFVSVGLGYYAVRAASRFRLWRGRTVGQVQPRADARMVAGCLMGVAAAALLPVFDPSATFPAASVMAAAFLMGLATDWLIICGQATPDGRPRQRRLAAWQAAGARALPLFLRASVAIGIVLFISESCFDRGMAFLAGFMLLGLLCALGVAARLAAMILSVIMADLISTGCRGAGAALALAAAVSLMMTGAGQPRIWQPEDMFFLKKRP
jgi:phosphatidylglycerophosphate synthase